LLVVRPIVSDDLDALYKLAKQAKAGITTLPLDRDVLEKRINEAVLSFQRNASKPGGEMYLFVLHDTENDQYYKYSKNTFTDFRRFKYCPNCL